jgi:hypothetical protein
LFELLCFFVAKNSKRVAADPTQSAKRRSEILMIASGKNSATSLPKTVVDFLEVQSDCDLITI